MRLSFYIYLFCKFNIAREESTVGGKALWWSMPGSESMLSRGLIRVEMRCVYKVRVEEKIRD